MRIGGHGAAHRWEEASSWFADLFARASSSVTRVRCGELGELNIVFEPIAFRAARGYVAVGSTRETFPELGELAVIRSATALATTSLEMARALLEREEALRAKDEFLAVVGHELRNPLAPIVSALEIIGVQRAGRLSREEEVIRKQVDQLRRMVDDLLDIARMKRGAVELRRADVDLADVLDEAVEATEILFRAKSQRLRRAPARSGLVVFGDAARLTQVFVNLLVNATKYTPEGGTIEVETSACDGRAVVRIRDDGIGITEDLLGHLFEPFVQARRVTDPQYGGLGIGLALVRTLVTKHGGTVTAGSGGRGRGSTFVVELPLTNGAAEGARRPPERPSDARRAVPKRVLVIDDNRDAGEMLGEALTLSGCDVLVLDDPAAAIDASEAFGADVVVLDLGMPVLDGYSVAARIRERLGSRAPAFVAVTGFGQSRDRERTTAAGFSAHFVKPVSIDELVSWIEAHQKPETQRMGSFVV